MQHRIKNSLQEKGNTLLVVSTAIAFSLISAIIVLGIDTLTVKIRSTRLYLATSDIARRLTPLTLRQGELLPSFVDEIKALQENSQLGNGVEITDAVLISPVMPQEFVYLEPDQGKALWAAAPKTFTSRNAYEGEILQNVSHDFFEKGVGYRPPEPFCVGSDSSPTNPACKRVPFASLSSTYMNAVSCSLLDVSTGEHNKDCLFQGYSASLVLDDQNNALVIADETAPIPLGALSNLQNSGNTVGIYLAARTSTWLSGTREVSAIALVRTLPRGINSIAKVPGIPASLPVPSGSVNTALTTPGLFIAVAPQLEIPDLFGASNKHFSFGYFPKTIDLRINPLAQMESYGTVNSSTPFGASSANQEAGGNNFIDASFTVEAPPTTSDLEEVKTLAAACSNPISQMRNTFISTLLEMAARDGNFRAGIEFLLVNSLANFPLKAGDSAPPLCEPNSTSLGKCSWPTVIVEKGDDIAKNQFQIPYTTMNFGQNNSAPVQGGFTYAVQTEADGRSSLIKNRQLRFASQLRSCYNLYAPRLGSVTSQEVLGRYSLGLDSSVNNPFVSPDTFPAPSTQRFTRESVYFTPGKTWDQECAYGEGSGCIKTYSLEGLTAAQVAASLGTVQLCSLRSSNDSACPRLPHYDPSNPTLASRIRPDFVALMRYINAGLIESSELEGAIESPGMWPISSFQTSGTGLDNLFSFSDLRGDGSFKYMRSRPNSSLMNLLLVSHLPPSEAESELNELARQINIFNHAGFGSSAPLMLRVIVAYFPASSFDAQASVIERWQRVLSIASLREEQSTSFNRLLVFSPYNSKFAGADYDWLNPSLSDEERFGLYWRDHLLAASDTSYGKKELIYNYADSDVPVRRAEETFFEILNEVGDLL